MLLLGSARNLQKSHSFFLLIVTVCKDNLSTQKTLWIFHFSADVHAVIRFFYNFFKKWIIIDLSEENYSPI